jgi:hypothetical protein
MNRRCLIVYCCSVLIGSSLIARFWALDPMVGWVVRTLCVSLVAGYAFLLHRSGMPDETIRRMERIYYGVAGVTGALGWLCYGVMWCMGRQGLDAWDLELVRGFLQEVPCLFLFGLDSFGGLFWRALMSMLIYGTVASLCDMPPRGNRRKLRRRSRQEAAYEALSSAAQDHSES